MRVELHIYIYHEGCLSGHNEFNLCNSWYHQTFHGKSLGPGVVEKTFAGQTDEVCEDWGEGGFGLNITQMIIKCN